MNQKITLRFADHVLTFEVPEEEAAKVKQDMRRKWLHRFVRANGDFYVNFAQVLWMKVSPGDEAEVGWEAVETVQEQVEEFCALYGTLPAPSGTPGQPR